MANTRSQPLAPHELIVDSYVIDVPWRGKPMPAELQTLMAGNAVCPDMARALVAANLGIEAEREVAA